MMSRKKVTTSPAESKPATVRVPEPYLLDLLIDHVLVDHIVPERPIDIRPDRVLELLTDHLLEIPIEHEVAIPVDWALDHMLNHLWIIEEAMEEAMDRVAEEMAGVVEELEREAAERGVNHD